MPGKVLQTNADRKVEQIRTMPAMKAGKYERRFILRHRLFHGNDSKWIVVGHYGDIEQFSCTALTT